MLQKITACVAVISALVLLVDHLAGEDQTQPSDQQVFEHRLPRVDWIRTASDGGFHGLILQVAVDEHGTVTSAQLKEGPYEFREAALTLAKTWKYKPFGPNGKPQAVIITDHISILPPELPARMNVPFPPVVDWAKLTIMMRRGQCYGTCSAYEVWISGNGDVYFHSWYPKEGEHQGRVSRKELERLVEAFRAALYYGLDPEYKMAATDLSPCRTSISIDGHSMSVLDYGGLQVGMPTSVRDLEFAIDEVAGTRTWLRAGEDHPKIPSRLKIHVVLPPQP